MFSYILVLLEIILKFKVIEIKNITIQVIINFSDKKFKNNFSYLHENIIFPPIVIRIKIKYSIKLLQHTQATNTRNRFLKPKHSLEFVIRESLQKLLLQSCEKTI